MGCIQIASGSKELGGSAHPAEVPFGVEASHPSEDQGVFLAPATTASDDEISAAAYGPGRSSGMPVVRQGSGGLPALILRLPLGPNNVIGDGRQPPRGDLRGGILAVHRWRNISS